MAHTDRGLLFLMYHICSSDLHFRFLVVCSNKKSLFIFVHTRTISFEEMLITDVWTQYVTVIISI
jgi:hypothetical protein